MKAPPTFSQDLLAKAKKIRLLALDVDGVMTNGDLWTSAHIAAKNFNALDGMGIALLLREGFYVGLVSASHNSDVLQKRCAELGITLLLDNTIKKRSGLNTLRTQLNLQWEECAYMGDDWPDIPAIQAAGLGVTTADGHPTLRRYADYVTTNNGGDGAVREVCDLILHATDKEESLLQTFIEEKFE